jgi:hypothetical protein
MIYHGENLFTKRICSRCTVSHLRETVGVCLGNVAQVTESELRINENET